VKTFILVVLLTVLASTASAEFILGVGTHLNIKEKSKLFDVLKASRSNSIRQDFLWEYVEKEAGKYEVQGSNTWPFVTALAASGSVPLLVLDYGNKLYGNGKPVTKGAIDAYARYAQATAKEMRGKVGFYEIWNEWDHSSEPQSAEAYFELVKSAALAIRAVDKEATLLAGAATTEGIRKGWVEKLVKLGALKYIDGVSIHPYTFCEKDTSPETWLHLLSDLSNQLRRANGGKSVPIYITEMGWPTHSGVCGTNPETVARYLARALLLVRTVPEIKGLWWYDLKDDGVSTQDPEHNFGLLANDYSRKPAFSAFQVVAPFVMNARSVERMSSPSGIVAVVITGPTGKKSFAFWAAQGNSVATSLSIVRDRTTPFEMIKSGTGDVIPLPDKNTIVNLSLNGSPQIVTGVQSCSFSK
jgi:polysaccharide biosynthesis protein PslG